PNHVLPTGGTARFFSPLSIDDYIKKSSIISFSKDALGSLGEDVIKFANAEGLTAHANSVRVRL
ncbi:MAG: histidinol dehydrogenase, partial [Firmicutes bacterium]|nr:histidinol dehydrogenase [Bacillota bacterium]